MFNSLSMQQRSLESQDKWMHSSLALIRYFLPVMNLSSILLCCVFSNMPVVAVDIFFLAKFRWFYLLAS